MTTKSSTKNSDFTRVTIWVVGVLIVILLATLLINKFNAGAADTGTSTAPDQTVTVGVGTSKTFTGNGVIKVLCPNNRFSALANFNVVGNIDPGYRGGVTNIKSGIPNITQGSVAYSAIGRFGLTTSRTLAPGQSSGYLYPGSLYSDPQHSMTAQLATDSQYCGVKFLGFGDLTVTAIGTDLTAELYSMETADPYVGANDPVTVTTVTKKAACTGKINVTTLTDNLVKTSTDVQSQEVSKESTFNSYNSYSVRIDDTVSGATKTVKILDSNGDKKSRLEITSTCTGDLEVNQVD